jgi:CRP-like cAMP-binding protein
MGASETTQAQHLRTLAERGWLSLQSSDFQNRMITIGRWTAVPKGRALYVLGEAPDAIFGLGSGRLDISVPVNEEDVVVHRAPPGFWIGDGALLSGCRAS